MRRLADPGHGKSEYLPAFTVALKFTRDNRIGSDSLAKTNELVVFKIQAPILSPRLARIALVNGMHTQFVLNPLVQPGSQFVYAGILRSQNALSPHRTAG